MYTIVICMISIGNIYMWYDLCSSGSFDLTGKQDLYEKLTKGVMKQRNTNIAFAAEICISSLGFHYL